MKSVDMIKNACRIWMLRPEQVIALNDNYV
jgi:hypothetical protein